MRPVLVTQGEETQVGRAKSMELNGFWPVFGGGMLGPVLVELLKIASMRDTGKLTLNYKEPLYWIATVALLLVSGTVAVLNGIDHVSIQKAVQLGINAPALVAAYANASSARKARKKIPNVAVGDAALAQVQTPGTILDRTAEVLSW
jgi:hypothetical protein